MYHEVNELNYVKTFQNRIGGDGKFQKTSCAQQCAWTPVCSRHAPRWGHPWREIRVFECLPEEVPLAVHPVPLPEPRADVPGCQEMAFIKAH